MIKLTLVEPSGKKEEFETDYIQCKTTTGDMGIEPNHTASLVILKDGEIKIKQGKEFISRTVTRALLECDPQKAIVLADHFN